jgi:hypothetical protein
MFERDKGKEKTLKAERQRQRERERENHTSNPLHAHIDIQASDNFLQMNTFQKQAVLQF